jgi:hypothetical protein
MAQSIRERLGLPSAEDRATIALVAERLAFRDGEISESAKTATSGFMKNQIVRLKKDTSVLGIVAEVRKLDNIVTVCWRSDKWKKGDSLPRILGDVGEYNPGELEILAAASNKYLTKLAELVLKMKGESFNESEAHAWLDESIDPSINARNFAAKLFDAGYSRQEVLDKVKDSCKPGKLKPGELDMSLDDKAVEKAVAEVWPKYENIRRKDVIQESNSAFEIEFVDDVRVQFDVKKHEDDFRDLLITGFIDKNGKTFKLPVKRRIGGCKPEDYDNGKETMKNLAKSFVDGVGFNTVDKLRKEAINESEKKSESNWEKGESKGLNEITSKIDNDTSVILDISLKGDEKTVFIIGFESKGKIIKLPKKGLLGPISRETNSKKWADEFARTWKDMLLKKLAGLSESISSQLELLDERDGENEPATDSKYDFEWNIERNSKRIPVGMYVEFEKGQLIIDLDGYEESIRDWEIFLDKWSNKIGKTDFLTVSEWKSLRLDLKNLGGRYETKPLSESKKYDGELIKIRFELNDSKRKFDIMYRVDPPIVRKDDWSHTPLDKEPVKMAHLIGAMDATTKKIVSYEKGRNDFAIPADEDSEKWLKRMVKNNSGMWPGLFKELGLTESEKNNSEERELVVNIDGDVDIVFGIEPRTHACDNAWINGFKRNGKASNLKSRHLLNQYLSKDGADEWLKKWTAEHKDELLNRAAELTYVSENLALDGVGAISESSIHKNHSKRKLDFSQVFKQIKQAEYISPKIASQSEDWKKQFAEWIVSHGDPRKPTIEQYIIGFEDRLKKGEPVDFSIGKLALHPEDKDKWEPKPLSESKKSENSDSEDLYSDRVAISINSDLKAVFDINKGTSIVHLLGFEDEKGKFFTFLKKGLSCIVGQYSEAALNDWVKTNKKSLLARAEGVKEANTISVASSGLDTALAGGLPLLMGGNLKKTLRKNSYLDESNLTKRTIGVGLNSDFNVWFEYENSGEFLLTVYIFGFQNEEDFLDLPKKQEIGRISQEGNLKLWLHKYVEDHRDELLKKARSLEKILSESMSKPKVTYCCRWHEDGEKNWSPDFSTVEELEKWMKEEGIKLRAVTDGGGGYTCFKYTDGENSPEELSDICEDVVLCYKKDGLFLGDEFSDRNSAMQAFKSLPAKSQKTAKIMPVDWWESGAYENFPNKFKVL